MSKYHFVRVAENCSSSITVISYSIKKLINIFSKFPTVGPRTASRFVFYLLKTPQAEVEELIQAISSFRQKVKMCSFCFNPFEGEGELCSICENPGRNGKLLCVVEKETDLEAIEKISKYKGLYFILGGTVATLKKEEIKQLRSEELVQRIKSPVSFGLADASFEEVIIATNLTTEGEATAIHLERILKPLVKKITRLGRGLPIGGELEYADDETLSSALEGRK